MIKYMFETILTSNLKIQTTNKKNLTQGCPLSTPQHYFPASKLNFFPSLD